MDFDDAYANGAYIADSERFPAEWATAASAYRDRTDCNLDIPYGPSGRQVLDVFHPLGQSQGTLVFIHGGYWRAFEKSSWSHLAAGANAQGWTVAMPSYDLCPDVRISDITQQMVAALAQISLMTTGSIRLAGHSAGGHLVSRLLDPKFGADWQKRIDRVLPISPLSDLEPLSHTKMNEDFQLTTQEVQQESPINQAKPNCAVKVWVGGEERPAFIDQATWLSQKWECDLHIEQGRHHFDVIDDLANSKSDMVKFLVA